MFALGFFGGLRVFWKISDIKIFQFYLNAFHFFSWSIYKVSASIYFFQNKTLSMLDRKFFCWGHFFLQKLYSLNGQTSWWNNFNLRQIYALSRGWQCHHRRFTCFIETVKLFILTKGNNIIYLLSWLAYKE